MNKYTYCENCSNMNIVAWQTKTFPKFLFVKTFKGPTMLKTSLSEDEDENIPNIARIANAV